uniref:Uncharacterized protein n=2 Tax=Plectus sambesii TaxID=2011161 RepID=A0A914W2J6_9BILA
METAASCGNPSIWCWASLVRSTPYAIVRAFVKALKFFRSMRGDDGDGAVAWRRIHPTMVVVGPLKGRRSPPNSAAADLLLLALTSSALFIAVERYYWVETQDATPIDHASLTLQADVQSREIFAVHRFAAPRIKLICSLRSLATRLMRAVCSFCASTRNSRRKDHSAH